jgi:hypothetical protein
MFDARAGVYATSLEVTKPSTVKPGQQFQIAAKLSGLFFVKWIYPSASGQGAYILLYQGNKEIGRYRISQYNTAVTRSVTAVGPSGWNDLIGLGSETIARFNVTAPSKAQTLEYSVVYTGEKWSNSANSGVLKVKAGYPNLVPAITPLLLGD